jgi:hypothetical protein
VSLSWNSPELDGAWHRYRRQSRQLLRDADTAWLLLRDQVNAACEFFVHTTTAKNPALLRPKLSPSKVTMTVAKRLLSQACQGAVQEDLLKGFVPLERRWIEGLHLTLNTGNAAYEHARNTLCPLKVHYCDGIFNACICRCFCVAAVLTVELGAPIVRLNRVTVMLEQGRFRGGRVAEQAELRSSMLAECAPDTFA